MSELEVELTVSKDGKDLEVFMQWPTGMGEWDGKSGTVPMADVRKLIQPQWISVDDRLPEAGVPVIGMIVDETPHDPVTLVEYYPEERMADGRVYYSHWGVVAYHGVEADANVTHWQPLPPAPKERG